MARERPAVVQGPFHAALTRRKPFKQHFNVDVVTVQIVKVYDIGLYLIKAFEQALRCSPGVKASLAVEACPKSIKLDLGIGSKSKFVVALPCAATTPENVRLLARGQKLLVLLHHDAAGRTIRHRIYVSIHCHYRLFLHTILSTTPV